MIYPDIPIAIGNRGYDLRPFVDLSIPPIEIGGIVATITAFNFPFSTFN